MLAKLHAVQASMQHNGDVNAQKGEFHYAGQKRDKKSKLEKGDAMKPLHPRSNPEDSRAAKGTPHSAEGSSVRQRITDGGCNLPAESSLQKPAAQGELLIQSKGAPRESESSESESWSNSRASVVLSAG